jgi:hypothetical protein
MEEQPAADEAATTEACTDEAISAEYSTARQWAAQRGVEFVTWEDLPRVNDRRDSLGLARFKRSFRRAAGTPFVS